MYVICSVCAHKPRKQGKIGQKTKRRSLGGGMIMGCSPLFFSFFCFA